MATSGDEEFIKDPTAFTALTKIHKQAVLDCCFAPNSDQIITGGEDTFVVLWNLPHKDTELHDDTINDEHKLVCYRLADHKHPVMSVAIHDKLFLSASKDGHVKLWKLIPEVGMRDNQRNFMQPVPEPRTYYCHTRIIRSSSFSHDAKCFATASDDNTVKIWSTESINKSLVSFLDGHTNWIKCVRWAKTNSALLASCGDDGRICIWDTRTKVRQPPCQLISRRRTQFNCLDWHPVFGHHLVTGAQDSSCVVWDVRNGKQVQVYVEHNGSVNSVAFNPGGSLLLSGSSDKTSKIFDVCEGKNMFTLMSHNAPITSVCFNAAGDMLATGSQDKTVTVWNRNFDVVNIIPYDEESDQLDITVIPRESDDDLGGDQQDSSIELGYQDQNYGYCTHRHKRHGI